jgi:hypothetical protein
MFLFISNPILAMGRFFVSAGNEFSDSEFVKLSLRLLSGLHRLIRLALLPALQTGRDQDGEL